MPYAAKAQIEQEFDTDHLNIWVTFRSPMNITVKPLDTFWTVYVDNIIMPVTISVWEDMYTMLLHVPDIISKPARVLVKYTGPDVLLRTTWHKQWEPWGSIFAKDVTV